MRTLLGIRQYAMLAAGLLLAPTVAFIAFTPADLLDPRPAWLDVPQSPARPLSTPYTVLAPEIGARLFPLCSRRAPGLVIYTWMIDSTLAAQLEEDLARILPHLRFPRQGRSNPPPLDTYYRQYVGITTLAGARLIYVNAFQPRTPWLQRWKAMPIDLCDGGYALWGLEYDPATRRFRGLTDNGWS